MKPTRPHDPLILAIIREAAAHHRVPAQVAFAFAWCESRLNPRAEGDLEWHLKRNGDLYRTLVLDSPKFRQNPFRKQPELWHSYGLFQLLATYHVKANEDPRELLDPVTNADRGCKELARLLRLAGGDVESARLAYVGCGLRGHLCAGLIAEAYRVKLREALERFAHEGAS